MEIPLLKLEISLQQANAMLRMLNMNSSIQNKINPKNKDKVNEEERNKMIAELMGQLTANNVMLSSLTPLISEYTIKYNREKRLDELSNRIKKYEDEIAKAKDDNKKKLIELKEIAKRDHEEILNPAQKAARLKREKAAKEAAKGK